VLPVKKDGSWVMKWEKRQLTEQEIQKKNAPYPTTNKRCVWDEETTSWIEITP
jgi:hypothetical protein